MISRLFRRPKHRAASSSVRAAKARGVSGTGEWQVYRRPDPGFLTRPPKLRQPLNSR